MVDLALPRQLHAIGGRAIDEATRRGATTAEAEHVLLAIAADSTTAASGALAAAGLGYDALVDALREERARSLAVAGVAPVDEGLLEATPRASRPGWGASARDLMRAAERPAGRDRRPGIVEIELTIGILRAELGTVPRMLAIAGIDRVALIERLRLL